MSKCKGYIRTFEVTPWGQLGRTQATTLSKPGLLNNAGGLSVGVADPRTLFLASAFLDVAKRTSFGMTYQSDIGHGGTAILPTQTKWQLNWQLTF